MKEIEIQEKDYIVVVQCDIVMERCSGYYCEKAFNERGGGFAVYPRGKAYRTLYLTCGGCCGRAIHRKVYDLIAAIREKEGVKKDKIAVHLSSCITKESYHGPKCPHVDYLKTMIEEKLSLDLIDATTISRTSEGLRKEGDYKN
jgi:predicted metal-binding protein